MFRIVELLLRRSTTSNHLTRVCQQVRQISNISKYLDENQNNDDEGSGSESSNNDSADPLVQSEWYLENGLRKVYPYYYQYKLWYRPEWSPCLIEVVHLNSRQPKERIISQIMAGDIRVNGKRVQPGYRMKEDDWVDNWTHRHELPVFAVPIPIIYDKDDILVIDKPPSIPVHTCNSYRYNTVHGILRLENKIQGLHHLHRIDRTASGVLIFTRTIDKLYLLKEEMQQKNIQKDYVCRVEGDFPDGITICNEPIDKFDSYLPFNVVSKVGKSCMTKFKKLSFNGKTSAVLCRPITGRTHQLRVHLQFLGFPIVNDRLYNNFAFGPEKGKGGRYGYKSRLELKKELTKSIQDNNLRMESDEEKKMVMEAMKHYFKDGIVQLKEFDQNKLTKDENCNFCNNPRTIMPLTNMFIFLHALRYKSELVDTFETNVPFWATKDWQY